jgi:hypothetical protein
MGCMPSCFVSLSTWQEHSHDCQLLARSSAAVRPCDTSCAHHAPVYAARNAAYPPLPDASTATSAPCQALKPASSSVLSAPCQALKTASSSVLFASSDVVAGASPSSTVKGSASNMPATAVTAAVRAGGIVHKLSCSADIDNASTAAASRSRKHASFSAKASSGTSSLIQLHTGLLSGRCADCATEQCAVLLRASKHDASEHDTMLLQFCFQPNVLRPG